MIMHIASVLESQKPKAEIDNGKNKSALNRVFMYISEPMLGPVPLHKLSGWKRFLFSAGCLRNKNVLKLEAGMLEKIRTF